MALTQFNQWEPQLDPVNGVMAQEPRLFAHDAVAVVVGAINNSDSNHGLKVTNYSGIFKYYFLRNNAWIICFIKLSSK